MKTQLIIKSLADIPAEAASVNAAAASKGKLDAQPGNASLGTPGPVLLVRAEPGPVPPGLYEGRDARLFEPQPWPRGGLNE
jgi:hypothetical protein